MKPPTPWVLQSSSKPGSAGDAKMTYEKTSRASSKWKMCFSLVASAGLTSQQLTSFTDGGRDAQLAATTVTNPMATAAGAPTYPAAGVIPIKPGKLQESLSR